MVLGDESPLHVDREVEYCPPKTQDLPYESSDFPVGCLNYEPLKPGNLTKRIWRVYHMPDVDDTEADRHFKSKDDEAIRKIDEAILKSLEDDWKVGDVPETYTLHQKKLLPRNVESKQVNKPTTSSVKPPPTVMSRKAASALGLQARLNATPSTTKVIAKPKPDPLPLFSRTHSVSLATTDRPSNMRHCAAIAAAKSTIGYSKGRSASSAIPLQRRHAGLTRNGSNVSAASDVTITPGRFAQQEDREARRLPWLAAFDADDENIDPLFKGGAIESLRNFDDEEEEFVMTLDP